MSDSLGLNPLCIILVKSGAHGGKLLFRYPFHVVNREQAGLQGRRPRANPYSVVTISEDLLSHSAQVKEPSNIKDGQLDGLSDETLANLFAVSKRLCGSKFELKLNDVRFVGHPVCLEEEYVSRSKKISGRKSTITMFHVVFALRDSCTYSVISCYAELSQRLGIILRHEERRCGYLTHNMKALIAAADEVMAQSEDSYSHPFSLATERSHLARDIETMYSQLCEQGEVHLYVNKWVELSFCLPQKVHRKHFPDLLVEPESLYLCLEQVRPYHCLLLLQEVGELLDSLTTDSSPALRRLVRQCSPLRSLSALAMDTDLSLPQVFQLTGHLLYWGKATVIYPLCESNLYVLSPRLPCPLPKKMVDKFSSRFPGETLLETLSTFSLPTRLSLAPPLPLHQPRVVEVLVWLLQHLLISQVHTYLSLAADQDITFCCQPLAPQGARKQEPGCPHHGEGQGKQGPDSSQDLKDREALLSGFSASERANILALPASRNLDDLTKFVHLSKYFQGNHHLEEIMYRENMSRAALLQLIDKFRDILIKHEHEDPAISIYLKSNQGH